MNELEDPLSPEQALLLWDLASDAYHNRPENPPSCARYEQQHNRCCPCEREGQILIPRR